VIRDLDAYERLRVEEEIRALQALSYEDAIAMTEALLTSSLMALFDHTDSPRPLNLVRGLGIDPDRVVRGAKPTTP
jgi:hypothetical protein